MNLALACPVVLANICPPTLLSPSRPFLLPDRSHPPFCRRRRPPQRHVRRAAVRQLHRPAGPATPEPVPQEDARRHWHSRLGHAHTALHLRGAGSDRNQVRAPEAGGLQGWVQGFRTASLVRSCSRLLVCIAGASAPASAVSKC